MQLAQAEKAAVINGDDAELGDWPWMVGLVEAGFGTPQFRLRCGATLIKERYLLTAAHCVADFGVRASIRNLVAVIGQESLLDRDAPRITFSDIIVHPHYDPNSYALRHDLALIRLSKPVTNRTVSIWPIRIAAGTSASVLGWGQISSTSNRAPKILQIGNVPVTPDRECKQRHGRYFEAKTIMCAGVLSSAEKVYDGVDSCYGDSGGPLITNINGEWQQIGIVSSGFECASHAHYGMYTRLSNYYNWIEEHSSDERELAFLLRDIHKKVKLLNIQVRKLAKGLSFSVNTYDIQRVALAALVDEYSRNKSLEYFSRGKERRLERLLKRSLDTIERQPNVSAKHLKKAVTISRTLKQKHAF